jgi:hypothetical protein
LLDEANLAPRAALWAHTSEADAWRLWIVPPVSIRDKREFYLRLADVFAEHGGELAGLDLGEVQFTSADHPVIQGLSRIFRISGVSDIRFSNNVLDGFFLPDSVIVRMDV